MPKKGKAPAGKSVEAHPSRGSQPPQHPDHGVPAERYDLLTS
jgi:hypothetical protein